MTKEELNERLAAIITLLGGHWGAYMNDWLASGFITEPGCKPDITLDYLMRHCGVKYFKASEPGILTPPRDRIRLYLMAGSPSLEPEVVMLQRTIACLKVADYCREYAGPAAVRYLYRPPRWNNMVGGTEESDHLAAAGIDLRWSSKGRITRAHRAIEKLFNTELFGLSVGYSVHGLHVGVCAPYTLEIGQRSWRYA